MTTYEKDGEVHLTKDMAQALRAEALKLINKEREKQNKKFGYQRHSPGKWMLILQEEIGEYSKDVLEGNLVGQYEELIQICAVAVSMLEHAVESNAFPKGVAHDE